MYYYLHETGEFEYYVRAEPGPIADESIANVHQQRPDGPILKTIPLQKQGNGELSLPLRDFKLSDSPLFIEFFFRSKERKFKTLLALSLAEPAPATCAADPDSAAVNDNVKLKVTGWAALAYDRPGQPTDTPEQEPEKRIPQDARSSVKWQVDGNDLADKGESVSFTVKQEHLGKALPVEAYLGDTPPGRARAKIDCRLQVKLVLQDLNGDALAQNPCAVKSEGESENLATDGDGLLKIKVAKTPQRVALRVDSPPPSFDLDIPVLVGKLDPIGSLRGQQARLRNLGYFFGDFAPTDQDRPPDEEDPQAFPSAVEEFQCDQGLPVTGSCDSATQAKLKELHGC